MSDSKQEPHFEEQPKMFFSRQHDSNKSDAGDEPKELENAHLVESPQSAGTGMKFFEINEPVFQLNFIKESIAAEVDQEEFKPDGEVEHSMIDNQKSTSKASAR